MGIHLMGNDNARVDEMGFVGVGDDNAQDMAGQQVIVRIPGKAIFLLTGAFYRDFEKTRDKE